MRGKTFGAMNVLFLAGIQSMVIPSKHNPPPFSSLLLYSNNHAVFLLVMQFVPYEKSFIGAEYLVIPTVLCLMPFSCLWAGTISSAGGGGSEEPTRSRHTSGAGTMSKLPFAKYFSSAHSTSQVNSRTLSGATATSHPHTPRTTQGVSNHIDKLYPELRSEDHIAVTQTYSVHSDASSRHGSTVQERGGSENV